MAATTINVLELAKGAIQEQITNELGRVLNNLVDPNTSTKDKRKLVVTLVFEVDENRESVACSAQAKATLAAVKPILTRLNLDTDRKGNAVAVEYVKDNPDSSTGEVFQLRSVN